MKAVVDTDKLARSPGKGLRLEAKVAYRDGQAMLTVYGFWAPHVDVMRLKAPAVRCVLHRVYVPSSTPKAERRSILRSMCDLIAIEHGESYYLRSKLQ